MGYLQTTYAFSQRRACRTIGVHRAAIRYWPRVRADEPQRGHLRALAAQRPRWGYRRLHVLLERELAGAAEAEGAGEAVRINRKRVQRLYRLEGLAIRRRQRKRVARTVRADLPPSGQPREHLAMDFMQDVLADGRRFRTLNILDIITRECLAIEVDTSLPGVRVVRVLDQLVEWHGVPKRITVDNGPECAGQALDAWAYQHGVRLDFIEPGKPMQNGYLGASTANSATNA